MQFAKVDTVSFAVTFFVAADGRAGFWGDISGSEFVADVGVLDALAAFRVSFCSA